MLFINKIFFHKNYSMYFQKEKNITIKSNLMMNKPLSEAMMKKSNSDFSGDETTTYRFPPKKLKIFFNDINRNSSEEWPKIIVCRISKLRRVKIELEIK